MMLNDIIDILNLYINNQNFKYVGDNLVYMADWVYIFALFSITGCCRQDISISCCKS